MEGTFSVCIMEGDWREDDNGLMSELNYTNKTWDELLPLLAWSLSEGYACAINRETGG